MTTSQRYDRIAFVASAGKEAQQALAQLAKIYGNHAPADADVVVALGGDGLMLQTLHRHMRSDKPSATTTSASSASWLPYIAVSCAKAACASVPALATKAIRSYRVGVVI